MLFGGCGSSGMFLSNQHNCLLNNTHAHSSPNPSSTTWSPQGFSSHSPNLAVSFCPFSSSLSSETKPHCGTSFADNCCRNPLTWPVSHAVPSPGLADQLASLNGCLEGKPPAEIKSSFFLSFIPSSCFVGDLSCNLKHVCTLCHPPLFPLFTGVGL